MTRVKGTNKREYGILNLITIDRYIQGDGVVTREPSGEQLVKGAVGLVELTHALWQGGSQQGHILISFSFCPLPCHYVPLKRHEDHLRSQNMVQRAYVR